MADEHLCEYCRASGHLEPDCPEARLGRGWRRTAGCAILFVMMPFGFFGILAGGAWGAAKAGFRYSAGLWDVLWKRFTRDFDAE